MLDQVLRKYQRGIGISITEETAVGVSARQTARGKWFAHLLSWPAGQRGWGVPMEPVRFFARRTVVPKEFDGRETEFIRYNHPDLIPLPEAQSTILRFSRTGPAGETLLHGIRETRLDEFLKKLRTVNRLPKLSGVVPPSVALASAICASRPDLSGKTLAILVGLHTTRYLGFQGGVLVNVFDDAHRPDRKSVQARFRKTLQRVLLYMESEGLGGQPDRIFLLGDATIRQWVGEVQTALPGTGVEYVDLLSEVGLTIPEDTSAEMSILAFGAAVASITPTLADLNFTGMPSAVAARRFDAYDLVIYGSLAAMLALSFVSLNAFTTSRIESLKDSLRSNSQTLRSLREEIDGKRGLVPVAEKLLEFSEPRVSDRIPVGRQVMDSLPDFLAMISETIPDGVRLDRVGSGTADSPDESARAYRSILPKTGGARQITVVGQTRFPDKAMRWAEQLSKRLGTSVVMEEMKSDAAGVQYQFRIVVSSGGENGRA